jgi:hypothetical protein
MIMVRKTKRPKPISKASQGVNDRPKDGGQAAVIIRFLFGYRPKGAPERESKFSSPPDPLYSQKLIVDN